MSARRRRSRRQSITNEHYQRQLKRTTFFLERSLGGKIILEELRKVGLQVEPHKKWFRHNTPDEEWLPIIGEKKWIVLMRDLRIGSRVLELNALLTGGVKAFALVAGEVPDKRNAEIVVKALPKILDVIAENDFPFIAKVHKNGSVELWKTELMIHKGIQFKRRK
jgi:hypothetical protein